MADILYTNSADAANNPQISDKSPALDASRGLLTRWYTFGQGRFWCIANVACALLAASLTWDSLDAATIPSWTIFVVLNSVLFLYLLGNPSARSLEKELVKSDPTIFFAAVLGSAWGALLFLTAAQPDELQFLHLQLIILMISALAIPVCALHTGAFTTYSLALLLPTMAIDSQQSPANRLLLEDNRAQ